MDERAGGGVSCKIAAFLTPTSTLFVIDTHEKKIISTGYTPYSDADYIEPLPVAPEAINLLQVSEFESNGRLRVREADFKVPHDLRDSGALPVSVRDAADFTAFLKWPVICINHWPIIMYTVPLVFFPVFLTNIAQFCTVPLCSSRRRFARALLVVHSARRLGYALALLLRKMWVGEIFLPSFIHVSTIFSRKMRLF